MDPLPRAIRILASRHRTSYASAASRIHSRALRLGVDLDVIVATILRQRRVQTINSRLHEASEDQTRS